MSHKQPRKLISKRYKLIYLQECVFINNQNKIQPCIIIETD